MKAYLDAVALAVKYRKQVRELQRALATTQRELHQAHAANHSLSSQNRALDATNAILTEQSRRRDFHPAGGFEAG